MKARSQLWMLFLRRYPLSFFEMAVSYWPGLTIQAVLTVSLTFPIFIYLMLELQAHMPAFSMWVSESRFSCLHSKHY